MAILVFRAIHFTLPAILLARQVHSNCFLPNGTDRNTVHNWHVSGYQGDSPYSKCGNETMDFGMCCAAWNVCRSDGLCYDYASGLVWRESCSMISSTFARTRKSIFDRVTTADRLWQSPKCLRLCMTGFGISPPPF